MNPFQNEDTIAAVATPPGEGGVAIIRVSGPQAEAVLRRVFAPTKPWTGAIPSHRMRYGRVMDGPEAVDDGMAVFMAAPKSYTGEDTAEIHCHGGMAVTQAVLQGVLRAGARLAQPGEFTRRAFIHGRMGLSEAEAVRDLIKAQSQAAARVALQQLHGRLGREIQGLCQSLLDTLCKLEVTVDYPEDDLEELAAFSAAQEIQQALGAIEGLLATANTGRIYREGVRCVLVGRPNAGKSSLMNMLLGEDRVMVTPLPGTTRDTVEAELEIGGVRLSLVDTAGLRPTKDQLESLGVARARNAMESAQLILWVLDAAEGLTAEDHTIYAQLSACPHLIVWNKTDLPAQSLETLRAAFPATNAVEVSALTGQGLGALSDAIGQALSLGGVQPGEAVVSNVRHIEALRQAASCLEAALACLREGQPPDLCATDLRAAWRSLGTITGETADEAVIDRIFSAFCLGK